MTDAAPADLLESLRAALAGRYDVERPLGAGGMGTVFLGRDLTLDRPVAIKVIAPELAVSKPFRQRFLQEARTVAKLRHPNIVAVYSAGEENGLLYFVMEYIPGESLRDLLARERCCAAGRATAILRDLAGALATAHAQGVIHRDIKPENVLLDRETGRAMLTDFGVAQALSAGDDRMTGTGFTVGSPRYMSPEQAAGERQLDGRSDIYSLGLVGYEMFAGEPAFSGPTGASVIIKQMTELPVPLPERAGDVPPAAAAVIHRALEKDPARRWQTADEMARALADGLTSPEGEGAPVGDRAAVATRRGDARAERPRRPARYLLAAAAVLLLAAVPIGWMVARGRSGPPRGVDPRKSFLVVPFENQTGDAALAWLREGSVNMLTLNLATWSDLSVVDYEHTLDLLRDAELEQAPRIGLEDARRLARRAGAWTVVLGQIARGADSLRVVARVYDVASGRPIRQAPVSAPLRADPRGVFDRLARELLDLAGAPNFTPELAKTTTSSLEAYRAYLAGVRALNVWQLDAADTALGRAIEADSTFALAYYKRAVLRGWRTTIGDTTSVVFARAAARYAGRLPERERNLVNAHLALTQGINISGPGGAPEARQLLKDAQQRYAALVARDSTYAEAWYGLGDAYFHDPAPPATAERATLMDKALRAFDRTLALDSTFHLAYPHKLAIYTVAATQDSWLVLDGDSVVYVPPNDSARQRYGIERVREARRRARERAVQDARRWVAADPDAPEAYRALSDGYLAANDPAAAVSALRQAMDRPAARLPEFPYRIAVLELRAGRPAEALTTLRQALQTYGYDSLKARGRTGRINDVMSAMAAAAYAGAARELEQLGDLAARLDPAIPFISAGGKPFPTRALADGYVALNLAAMGVEYAQVRRRADALLKTLDPVKDHPQLQGLPAGVAFSAYLFSRDSSYVELIRRYGGTQLLAIPAFQALRAVDRGDTAGAERIAAAFPRGDSTKIRPGFSANTGFLEAEVLTAVGDLRGAVATYEALDPSRLPLGQFFPDPRWPLYARSFRARAELYQQLGEREKAEAAYERFLELWKDADPRLQPQLQAARDALRRLRDAPATPIRR